MTASINSASNLKNPSSKFDAWEEAERIAMRILCEATGSSLGVNAFIGEIDDVCNSFFFVNDVVQYGGEAFYPETTTNFALPYKAVGIFDSRRAIQRWAMKIRLALPVTNVGNVPMFRLSNIGFGAIQMQDFLFRNEQVERPAYTMPVNFDLVVHVGND